MELYAIVALPALAACFSLLPAGRGLAPATTSLAAAAVLVLALRVALTAAGGQPVVAVDGWIGCDGLGALILLLVAFVGLTSSIFSWGYLKHSGAATEDRKLRRYYAHFNLFLLSMVSVPLLTHVALVWIAVELTTLLSVFLVSFEGTAEALEAAWKYVVLTCLGAALALVGVLLLHWGMTMAGGSAFSWAGLAEVAPKVPPGVLKTAFLFVLVGFGAKVGLVPLHGWLPDAHSQAPSPVCALLSGVETTTVLYAVLRLLPVLRADGAAARWLVVFGLASAGAAAFLLLQVKDYKRLFAFSTVEHMGIIMVAAGLTDPAAHTAAAYQMLSHALAKSFCFFAAGTALLAVGTRDIASVRGLLRGSPAAGVSLLAAGLAISGAPPFAVFLSELSIFRAGLASGHWLAIGLLTLFVVIAFCGIMLQVNRMVFGAPLAASATTPVPRSCLGTLLVAAVPVVALGLYMPQPLEQLLLVAAAALGR